MLSAVLPGVREFRTPLVTGVLWAACVWLLVGRPVSDSDSTREFVESFKLGDLPTTVWVGAAALATYLIGSLLVMRSSPVEWLLRRLRPKLARIAERLDEDREPPRRRHWWAWKAWKKYGWRGGVWRWLRIARDRFADVRATRWETVDGWLYNEFDSMVADGRVPVMRSFNGGCNAPNGFEAFYATSTLDDHPAFVENYDLRSSLVQTFVREVKQEKAAVEVRIQMRYPEVYAEIDRLKVEAELRMSIFWPLTLLCVLLGFAWTPLALVGLLVPPLLLLDGFKRAHGASEKTWGTLVAGEVTSPILDAMSGAKEDECRNFRARYERHEDQPSTPDLHVIATDSGP
ncbi:hypothetical protein [Pimelobacter simplex]|uniref:hypothetical protein n=1 Tax=Nocardioides simplex TaxID=2045 RepID=UPI003AADDA30